MQSDNNIFERVHFVMITNLWATLAEPRTSVSHKWVAGTYFWVVKTWAIVAFGSKWVAKLFFIRFVGRQLSGVETHCSRLQSTLPVR